jgi:hypothetical protein
MRSIVEMVLVADEQHLVADQRALQPFEQARRDVAAKPHVAHFRADPTGDRHDIEPAVGVRHIGKLCGRHRHHRLRQ